MSKQFEASWRYEIQPRHEKSGAAPDDLAFSNDDEGFPFARALGLENEVRNSIDQILAEGFLANALHKGGRSLG